MVQRKGHLAQLTDWKGKQVIKVVTGIRRWGKSTLLNQYQQWLKRNGVSNEQIVSINFEKLKTTACRISLSWTAPTKKQTPIWKGSLTPFPSHLFIPAHSSILSVAFPSQADMNLPAKALTSAASKVFSNFSISLTSSSVVFTTGPGVSSS